MIIKKFYGKNIEDARTDARQNLGNGFIILETLDAEGSQPACITVMVEKPIERPAQKRMNGNQVLSSIKNVVYQRSDAVLKPLRQLHKSISESVATSDNGENQEEKPKLLQTYEPKSDISQESEKQEPARENLSKRQLSLFDYKDFEALTASGHQPGIESFRKEFDEVKQKLNHLESLLSDSIVLTNLNLVSQPSFQQLLKAGIPSPIISSWFREIIESGITPEEDPEKFMLQLAGHLRNALPEKASEPLQKNIVFLGNSGSGKTSLIINLIENQPIMKIEKAAIVIIRYPDTSKYYTVLEPFAKDKKIPLYVVSSSKEVTKLLPNLEKYDHVFFDTPSINFGSEEAFDAYWKLRQVIAAIQPLETHLVINANTKTVITDYKHHNPIQPDFIDLTHMDEIPQWGQLLPIIRHFSCPVRFMSQGPRDIDYFDTMTFADTILSRS